MEGIIVSFRRGKRTMTGNQVIIEAKGNSKELIGKTVTWTSPGKLKKDIKGKITALHGTKGRLRVLMEKGMPGQSIGEKVMIE